MVNWETLRLIPTPESTLETIITIIILNALVFLILGLISSIILIVVTGGEYIQDIKIKNNKLRTGQGIVIIVIMCILTLTYIISARETYYTIEVGITTDELQVKDIHNIREMKEFPEKIILEKFKDSAKSKTIYRYKTTYNYYPRYTRLLNENNNIVFTTKLNTFDYAYYETPEEFKKDIEALVKYTIEYTKKQAKKNPEIMNKFTQEHTKEQPKKNPEMMQNFTKEHLIQRK